MHRSRGFTLIELLVVVAIIGLLSAVVIPALLHALHRSRQSATMADLRAIATAFERYAIEHHRYPVADELHLLRPALEPDTIKRLPLRDGWGHPFRFDAASDGSTYTLRSPGRDGVPQTEPLTETAEGFDADIVLQDGVFLQRPPGSRDGGEAPPTPPAAPARGPA